MTEKEKLNLIEDTFELEKDSLTSDVLLESLEQYDSLAKLTLIVMFDDNFNIKITGENVKQFKSVGDIIKLMN